MEGRVCRLAGSPLVTRDRSMLDVYAFDWEAP